MHVTYNHALSSTSPLTYDLGVRFGQAPQITEDYFIGRDRELEQLQLWLVPTPSKQNIVVLHGMGGIGKTQLSIHFVRQTYAKYTAVFWLNAKDEKTLRAGLAALAVEVSESSTAAVNTDDEERLVQQARKWLSRPENGQWLLLHDNYDNPKLPGISSSTAYDIRTYFPSRAHGSILITTRSSRVTFGKQLHLRKLENDEQSLSILAVRSGRSVDNDHTALKLVQRLDGLPLALATAGIYLNQSIDSFDDYLQLYNNSWHDLQCNDHGPEDYQERTLYSTWNVSFQQIERQDPVAALLLALLAYFDNQGLTYELFYAGRDLDNAPSWWDELLQSRPRFQRAVSMLQNYSLLELQPEGYRLHPCVHDWTLEHLNHETDPDRYRIALNSIAQSVCFDIEKEYWVQNRWLLPHARRLQHYRDQGRTVQSSTLPEDQIRLGFLFETNDMYQEAEQMYEQALAMRQETHGLKHSLVFRTTTRLGCLYRKSGKLTEAEQLFKRALAGSELILGAEHASTIEIVHSLGLLYANQGKLAEAEQMYQRALIGNEKALGLDHITTLETVHNFASLYRDQGRPVEAEQLYERALAGFEKVYKVDHTSVLITMHNLALLYANQGKLVEAEQMYMRALTGKEKTLGADHSFTLTTVHNLGGLYADQGKLVEAEQMYQRALEGGKKSLGSYHIRTFRTLNKLGLLYFNQGRLVEAEQVYEQALTGYERVLEPEHIWVLDTVSDIGSLYASQGKLAEAEQMYDRALAGYRKNLNEEHPLRLERTLKYADLSLLQHKPEKAKHLYQQIVATCARTLLLTTSRSQSMADTYAKALSKLVIMFSRNFTHAQSHFLSLIEHLRQQDRGHIVAILSLAKALLHLKDDDNARQDLLHCVIHDQSQPLDLGGTCCDACHHRLNTDKGMNVCRQCVDTNLCDTCLSTDQNRTFLAHKCQHDQFYNLGETIQQILRSSKSRDLLEMDIWLEELGRQHAVA